ncbi:hypothetical protein [Paenibacillus massiliensis]|uniref:hypothetical protein n=1 Tax=Paenibacillus massiliensis TaxID=225917 RepID=UPI00041F2F0C|nr:hypothetical protein [Paenibacillus massiliensis]
MARFRTKAIVFTCLVGMGMLLGMQLAGSGLRTVYGPTWDQSESAREQGTMSQTVMTQTAPIATEVAQVPSQPISQPTEQSSTVQPQVPIKQTVVDASLTEAKFVPLVPVAKSKQASVDVMADKTAGLLQKLSKKGIHLVVSMFEGVTE